MKIGKTLLIPHVTLCAVLSHFSRVGLFAVLWPVAHQAPLSMGFSKQEYWRGFPYPTAGDLPNPRIKRASLTSPALGGRFFTTEPPKVPYRGIEMFGFSRGEGG